MDEEFTVSVPARHRTVCPTADFESLPAIQPYPEPFQRRLQGGVVLDEATLADMAPANFELRLEQGDQIALPGRQR